MQVIKRNNQTFKSRHTAHQHLLATLIFRSQWPTTYAKMSKFAYQIESDSLSPIESIHTTLFLKSEPSWKLISHQIRSSSKKSPAARLLLRQRPSASATYGCACRTAIKPHGERRDGHNLRALHKGSHPRRQTRAPGVRDSNTHVKQRRALECPRSPPREEVEGGPWKTQSTPEAQAWWQPVDFALSSGGIPVNR